MPHLICIWINFKHPHFLFISNLSQDVKKHQQEHLVINVPYQIILSYQTAVGDFLCFLSPRLHPAGRGTENNRGSCCPVNWVQVRMCYSKGAGLSFLSYQEMPDLLQIRKTRMRLSIALRLMRVCSKNTDRGLILDSVWYQPLEISVSMLNRYLRQHIKLWN